MLNIPLVDVIDRYCIALLKHARTNESRELELYTLGSVFGGYFFKDRKDICIYIDRLMRVHAELWDTEASIRQAQEEELGLEEVGRRAIKIRDLNQKRQDIKNEIINRFGEGFKDIKCNYSKRLDK